MRAGEQAERGSDRAEHPCQLLCYKTKNTAFGTVPTFTNNQFGPAQPLLIHRRELCVPSVKNPVGSPSAAFLGDSRDLVD